METHRWPHPMSKRACWRRANMRWCRTHKRLCFTEFYCGPQEKIRKIAGYREALQRLRDSHAYCVHHHWTWTAERLKDKIVVLSERVYRM